MRRYLAASLLLFVVGLLCLAQQPSSAFWQSRDSNYNKSVSSGFTPSCSQSTTFLAAATGVTLTADKMNYDTLICGLVSDSVWNFDVLYIWAAPTQATALINLANPGTFNGTANGSVSFTAYQGFTGDGSSFYVDSGLNVSTATKFLQNDAAVGFYILTSRGSASNVWNVGCSVGGCVGGPLASGYTNGGIYGVINTAGLLTGGGVTDAQGAWSMTRTDGLGQGAFLNSGETPVNQSSDISIAPPNVNVIFFGFNTGFGLVTDLMAAGWVGAGVGNQTSGVASCKVNNRINTYMASLAVPKNVYSNSAC